MAIKNFKILMNVIMKIYKKYLNILYNKFIYINKKKIKKIFFFIKY